MKKAIFLLLLCFVAVPAYAQGYCKSLNVTSVGGEPNDIEAFVVPTNEQFVLLKLYITTSGAGTWSLVANDNLSLNGQTGDGITHLLYEFPNPSAIVNADEKLDLSWTSAGNNVNATIIGHFEVSPITSDLTGDGKVDFNDFAIVAADWLNGV